MSGSVNNPITHVWRPSSARRVMLDGFGTVARGVTQTVPAPLAWPAKDPADVLDYEFDISAALVGNDGDSIEQVTATISPNAPGDLVNESIAADGTTALFWFSGGKAGTTYVVSITVNTGSGRTIGRVVLLPVLALSSATVSASALTTNLGAVVTDQLGNPILLGS